MSPCFHAISDDQLKDLCEWDLACFPNETWTEKMLRTHLEFHDGFVWQETEVRGYALVCVTPWEVEIFRIGTLPTYLRSGVARNLLESLFSFFPKKDFFLEVKANNLPALNLYQKVGFGVLETRKNYYPDGSTAILMTRKPNL
jgi:ribosomal-protein-alanine N-acetyltransferase